MAKLLRRRFSFEPKLERQEHPLSYAQRARILTTQFADQFSFKNWAGSLQVRLAKSDGGECWQTSRS
jgi:hypothetical protein